MGKDWKYALYLIGVIGIYVLVKLIVPKENSWAVTFAHDDKEPYGTYAFDQLLPSFFKGQSVKNSYKTFYELKDSLDANGNVIIIASSFNAGKADTEALLHYVEHGGTAFISANHFYDYFADTLGLATHDNFINSENPFTRLDSAGIYFTNNQFDSTQLYYYKSDNIHNYFSKVDSVHATVIARNDQSRPVTLRIARGKGQLILNCTPMTFTNIYLLTHTNNEFVSKTFSFFPRQQVYRTEFYHLGRMEAATPLRFILTTEPLAWAYYLTVISILVFMIFEAKRKQRIIPVITPLTNTTLEFVSIIGNLYYQKGDHKNMAEKKIQFFLEKVRTQYFLPTANRDETFIQHLSKKSGQSEERTRALVKLIDTLLASNQISKSQLVDLNDQLEWFNKQNT